MAEAVHLTWERTLPTRSLRAAWAVFSNTDRFNRAAGLGFDFRTEVDEHGNIVQVGTVKRLGMRIEWVDEPFEFVAPDWFRSVRHFRTGPLKRLTTTVHLRRSTDAVHLQYDIALVPAHWAARPIILLDAKTSIRPMVERTIDQAASQLGQDPKPYAMPTPLDGNAEQLVRSLADLAIGDRIGHTLRTGDLRTQDRLQPLKLAAHWGIDEDVVVRDMLTAVERGVLALRFDLLCPVCQGANNRRDSVDLHASKVHCPSCNIAFDGTFPDSVEVSFRPTPQVRAFEVPVDCVNSPAHNPHVLARKHLPKGGEVTWRGPLSVGAYRLDAPNLEHGASIEVRAGLRPMNAALDLGKDCFSPRILRIGPGEVEIAIRSRLPHDTTVQLERRGHSPTALTAGRLLEIPGASQMLPRTALPKTLGVSVKRVGLLAVEGRDAPKSVKRAVRSLLRNSAGVPNETFMMDEGRITPVAWAEVRGCWVGAYPSAQAALDAARTLLPNVDLAIAIDAGPVSILGQRDRQAPHGAVVDRVLAAARRLGVGRLGLDVSALDSVDVEAAITRCPLPLNRVEGAPIAWLNVPSAPVHPNAPPPSMVGGRYVMGAELARGGMGVVHQAVDQTTGEDVVVKTLLPELAADPAHTQRFFWEARITSRLDHPHAVQVYDYGADGPHAWLVMERLFGEELYQRLHRVRPLPAPQAVRIALAVLDALTAAHDEGVVHRDVKPANIFLCNQPSTDHAKLLDFGIAKAAGDDFEDDPNVIIGTPRYLSPDQVRREPLDGRSDLYTVGLLLYEMLAGDIPFQADNARELAFMRLETAPRPLPSRVPEPLAAVVGKALAVDKEQRWPSAKAMACALRELPLEDSGDEMFPDARS
ncbi:MAG: protein kinase [Myxococcota bacterium]